MIDISFAIRLPWNWFGRWKDRDIFYRHGMTPWKNKAWEIQLTWFNPVYLFEVELDLRTKGQSHAGPKFEISLFGLFFDMHIHDTRHWNHDENRWERYGEDAEDNEPPKEKWFKVDGELLERLREIKSEYAFETEDEALARAISGCPERYSDE